MPAGDGADRQLPAAAPRAGVRRAAWRPRPAVGGGTGRATAGTLGPEALVVPRILIAVLLLLIVALQLKLWGREGMAKVDDLERAIAAQRAENERLKARNAALEAEVVNLKESREAIEERARAELGLIAEDETFYHVIDDSAVDAPAKEPEQ
jgi:cell division protein FtsB